MDRDWTPTGSSAEPSLRWTGEEEKGKEWVDQHPVVVKHPDSWVLRYVDGLQLAEILGELRRNTRGYLSLEVVPVPNQAPRETSVSFVEGRVIVLFNDNR